MCSRTKRWLPARKHSGWLTSHPLLVRPFFGKVCKGSKQCREHAHVEGKNASQLQVWTWQESQLLVSGICALKTWYKNRWAHYPAPRCILGPSFPVRTEVALLCPGCKDPAIRKNDIDHAADPNLPEDQLTRHAECKWKDSGIPMWKPTCPACQLGHRKKRLHPSHNDDEGCRWHPKWCKTVRAAHTRPTATSGRPRHVRSGSAPREPRTPATEAAQGVPGTDVHGEKVGDKQEAEARVKLNSGLSGRSNL